MTYTRTDLTGSVFAARPAGRSLATLLDALRVLLPTEHPGRRAQARTIASYPATRSAALVVLPAELRL